MWLLAVALAVSVSVVVPSARVEPVRAAYPSTNMPAPASAILELNKMNCDKDVQYVIIRGARRNSPLCSRASSKLRCGDRQNNQRQSPARQENACRCPRLISYEG